MSTSDFQEIKNAIYDVYGLNNARIVEQESGAGGYPNLLIEAKDDDGKLYRSWLMADKAVGQMRWKKQ